MQPIHSAVRFKLRNIWDEQIIRSKLRRELTMRRRDNSLNKHTLAWIRLRHSQSIKREREEINRWPTFLRAHPYGGC